MILASSGNWGFAKKKVFIVAVERSQRVGSARGAFSGPLAAKSGMTAFKPVEISANANGLMACHCLSACAKRTRRMYTVTITGEYGLILNSGDQCVTPSQQSIV